MNSLNLFDWLVLGGALAFIVIYGAVKTRKNRNLDSYLLGGKKMRWGTIGLSIMATQASAITFLSTPGQAFDSGMGFIQIYFGLPIAVVIICYAIIPVYHRLKVFTAYEFLEQRFDLRVRLLTAFLFLVQRGLAAGITIYAPAIILSTILGWDLSAMNILVGTLVIIYTVSGGTKAVSLTQKWQMAVIMGGMFTAFFIIIDLLPDHVSFVQAIDVAGILGRMEVINFSVDLNERYTVWSGLMGGLCLSLSYFGADQSQVQRYLGGKNIKESRLGLLFNGMLKIPMQFFILLTGIMVFIFYQFNTSPVFFNQTGLDQINAQGHAAEMQEFQDSYDFIQIRKREHIENYLVAAEAGDEQSMQVSKIVAQELDAKGDSVRTAAKKYIKAVDKTKDIETNDTDYVFISFILNYLPHGLIGLLLAVILSAAMSSTAAELNALASTTTVDFYKRLFKKEDTDAHYVKASRWITVGWGAVAISFALLANLAENLIQFVNILGSIFYGTILGIFLVAFFIKKIRSMPVIYAALFSQIAVIATKVFTDISFLWFNVIGCGIVVILAVFIQTLFYTNNEETA